jgi:hypothetical protein
LGAINNSVEQRLPAFDCLKSTLYNKLKHFIFDFYELLLSGLRVMNLMRGRGMKKCRERSLKKDSSHFPIPSEIEFPYPTLFIQMQDNSPFKDHLWNILHFQQLRRGKHGT